MRVKRICTRAESYKACTSKFMKRVLQSLYVTAMAVLQKPGALKVFEKSFSKKYASDVESSKNAQKEQTFLMSIKYFKVNDHDRTLN